MFSIKEELNNNIISKLTIRFGNGILFHELSYDTLCITIDKNIIFDCIDYLYKEETLKYRFLTTLCGIHYLDSEKSIGVIYHLHSLTNNHRIRIKSFTEIENPVFPSITTIFNAANWMERETYDFFGIIFENHPNLKRILNADDINYFPMRKEYPIEDTTRDDKNDNMFGRS
ncbi:MAG: NADH-quinone oxidoreductase subunit C [Bacteroidota bacterium]|nr:NADH-quinone oxidoreductase subunit C [Bacteroidota bacterium]